MGISALLLRLFLLLLVWVTSIESRDHRLLVIGDSMVDVGNNGHQRVASARCDFKPYGISRFSSSPTGRCSDGYLIPDILAQRLHLPPPVASSTVQRNLTRGHLDEDVDIDFASAGAGLFNETNSDWGVDPFEAQVASLREAAVRHHSLLKSLVVIDIGSNDFLVDAALDPSQLVAILERGVQDLHAAGFERMVVFNVAPLGCAPTAIGARHACNDTLNRNIRLYNTHLNDFIDGCTTAGMDIVLADVYAIIQEVRSNHAQYGFTQVAAACCQGCSQAQNATENLCHNRSSWLFWDSVHLTEAGYERVVDFLWDGDQRYVRPINVNQLLELKNPPSPPSPPRPSSPRPSPPSPPRHRSPSRPRPSPSPRPPSSHSPSSDRHGSNSTTTTVTSSTSTSTSSTTTDYFR